MEKLGFEPRAAGWEARMLPLCFTAPLVLKFLIELQICRAHFFLRYFFPAGRTKIKFPEWQSILNFLFSHVIGIFDRLMTWKELMFSCSCWLQIGLLQISWIFAICCTYKSQLLQLVVILDRIGSKNLAKFELCQVTSNFWECPNGNK